MRIPDFKIKGTMLPTVPAGTSLIYIDHKENNIVFTSVLRDWDGFISLGEFKHPDLTEIYIDLAQGEGCKIKESILRDLWLQQNGLPEKWYVLGCKELASYFVSKNVKLTGCHRDYPYFIEFNGTWSYYGKEKCLSELDEITFDEFKKYYKQNKKEEIDYLINKFQAQQIIDAMAPTCGWRVRLAELWGKNMVLAKLIEIPNSLYNEMYAAANKEQKELLDSIFGKPKKEVDLTKFKKSSNPCILYEPTEDIPFHISERYKNKLWLNDTYYKFDLEKHDNSLYLTINYK